MPTDLEYANDAANASAPDSAGSENESERQKPFAWVGLEEIGNGPEDFRAFRVWLVIRAHDHPKNGCFASLRTIAHEARVDTSHEFRHLRTIIGRLVRDGFVVRTRRKGRPSVLRAPMRRARARSSETVILGSPSAPSAVHGTDRRQGCVPSAARTDAVPSEARIPPKLRATGGPPNRRINRQGSTDKTSGGADRVERANGDDAIRTPPRIVADDPRRQRVLEAAIGLGVGKRFATRICSTRSPGDLEAILAYIRAKSDIGDVAAYFVYLARDGSVTAESLTRRAEPGAAPLIVTDEMVAAERKYFLEGFIARRPHPISESERSDLARALQENIPPEWRQGAEGRRCQYLALRHAHLDGDFDVENVYSRAA